VNDFGLVIPFFVFTTLGAIFGFVMGFLIGCDKKFFSEIPEKATCHKRDASSYGVSSDHN